MKENRNYIGWIESRAMKGRDVFTKDDFVSAFAGTNDRTLEAALSRLTESGRVVSPWQNFYVIVPTEYRLKGITPPPAIPYRPVDVVFKAWLLRWPALSGKHLWRGASESTDILCRGRWRTAQERYKEWHKGDVHSEEEDSSNVCEAGQDSNGDNECILRANERPRSMPSVWRRAATCRKVRREGKPQHVIINPLVDAVVE